MPVDGHRIVEVQRLVLELDHPVRTLRNHCDNGTIHCWYTIHSWDAVSLLPGDLQSTMWLPFPSISRIRHKLPDESLRQQTRRLRST